MIGMVVYTNLSSNRSEVPSEEFIPRVISVAATDCMEIYIEEMRRMVERIAYEIKALSN